MVTSAKYQVFISSTFEDLIDEREQVIKAVLEMGHIPVGMEMFSAADEEQWNIIARHIEESDYYAVIVAHRLGSLTLEGVSYTRKEYEFAVAKGVPVLGFVIDEKAPWPADRVDVDSTSRTALDEFKSLVRSRPVSGWTSAEDLYGRFSVALMKALTANPREGWVRASTVGAGPEVTAEVIRLSSENASLRKQLAEAKEASEKEQRTRISKTIETLLNTTRTPAYRYEPGGEWQEDATVGLHLVFHVLAPEMLIEASVKDMASTLAMHIRTDSSRKWDIVATNQLKGLLADLMTLDLVQPSARKHPVSDKSDYWTLSALGADVLKTVRRVSLARKPDQAEPINEAG
ncbi:DUF4062 domain-containing protein [Leifsonia sp. TF02-11]|uniref:DUF4062 domain-containing protein n=1 Tax=Leifsonia sp. TF02-11 TaxID=2815212 RepID=UPI001AA13631|nr:DUF4062 domain-containing protein [Leifsonia sp. TF02-11]MBO1740154.1 DUF4062 domain-containing protein [Leifsonia sp. TF02-11]